MGSGDDAADSLYDRGMERRIATRVQDQKVVVGLELSGADIATIIHALDHAIDKVPALDERLRTERVMLFEHMKRALREAAKLDAHLLD
jgi:hypothetical protein